VAPIVREGVQVAVRRHAVADGFEGGAGLADVAAFEGPFRFRHPDRRVADTCHSDPHVTRGSVLLAHRHRRRGQGLVAVPACEFLEAPSGAGGETG
jgi:hypothetical protein